MGIVNGTALLDLCHKRIQRREVDMNVVMTEASGLIETQATAEKGNYTREKLNELLDLAEIKLKEIFLAQLAA